MNRLPKITRFAILLSFIVTGIHADNSNGLAPEVTDLNAKDISYNLEKKIPYLEQAFINPKPQDMNDGITVGELGKDGGNKETIMSFLQEISEGEHNETDSMLIYSKGKLLVESYYKRGRSNYPHYQMSITKSYTALAIGRAIALGHLTMEDLHKPVVHFLKEIDTNSLVAGASTITLHEAMHMHSGIRIDKKVAIKLMKQPQMLKGQGQIQSYMANSNPITEGIKKKFKYQGADPSMAMQVLEAVVPGSAQDFIKNELFAPMGISNFGWQKDVSGFPKAAAGSSIRSRDMLKLGMLILNKGKWDGKQLIPEDYIATATGPLDVTPQRTYGYFWWGHSPKIGGTKYLCKSGRGAGGQFILMFPKLDLIIVTTAHNKNMGKMLNVAPARIVPAFSEASG